MTFSLVIQPIKSKKMNKRISMKVQNKSESTNWFDKLWFLFLWFFNFFIFILLNNFQDQSQLFRGTERLTLLEWLQLNLQDFRMQKTEFQVTCHGSSVMPSTTVVFPAWNMLSRKITFTRGLLLRHYTMGLMMIPNLWYSKSWWNFLINYFPLLV